MSALAACGAEPDLIALCRKCLAVGQSERPADGRAVAMAVAEIRQASEERARQAEVRAAEQRTRQRVLVWSGGVAVAVLLAGVGVSLWQMARAMTAEGQAKANETAANDNAAIAQQNAEQARTERDAKDLALKGQVKAKGEAEVKRREAEVNLAYSQKEIQILGSVFGSLRPEQIAESGRPLQDVLKDNLKQAVQDLDGSAIGDPLVVAEMQNTLGYTLLSLGEAELAVEVLEKAYATRLARLAPDDPDTLTSMGNLAHGYKSIGKLKAALPLAEECYTRKKATRGADHPSTLATMNVLAAVYQDSGKLGLALPLYEECLKRTKEAFGADHPDTLNTMGNLAVTYRAAGKMELSLPLAEEVYERKKATMGADHPHTLQSMNNLAVAQQAAGKSEPALSLFEDCLKRMKATLGTDHPVTLSTMNNLAMNHQEGGKLETALPLLVECLKLRRGKLGNDHADTLQSMNNLAGVYRALGKLESALPLFEECLERRMGKLGADHVQTLTTMNDLAVTFEAAGRWELVPPLLEECLKRMKATLGDDHSHTLICTNNLGRAYCHTKDGEKASATYTAFAAGKRKQFPKDDPQFAGVLAQLAFELVGCDQHVTAEAMLRECLAVRQTKQPDAWTTFNAQSLLGAALVGQKKYADAEPLLVRGYEGLKERAEAIPKGSEDRIPTALDRLISLYTAADKPDEVKKYKALRAEYPAAKK